MVYTILRWYFSLTKTPIDTGRECVRLARVRHTLMGSVPVNRYCFVFPSLSRKKNIDKKYGQRRVTNPI